MSVSIEEIITAGRAALKARKAMQRASNARHALPPGSSRARVTTANARHATACEAYDRYRDALLALCAEADDDLEYHARQGL